MQKSTPISFMPDMIRAIQAGRKSVTRRLIKFPASIDPNQVVSITPAGAEQWVAVYADGAKSKPFKCKYGTDGDLLWIREGLRLNGDQWVYIADSPKVTPVLVKPEHEADATSWAHHKENDLCIAMFMPKFASRYTLSIVSLRPERLQEITEADAKDEGVNPWHNTVNGTVYIPEFKLLWDMLNIKNPWDSNPFVWRIGFKLVNK